MLHFAGCGEIHIQIGIYNGFLIPDRLGQIMPERINDTTAAPTNDIGQTVYGRLLMKILWIRVSPDNHIRINKIAFAFDGNMLDGSLPFRIIIGVWRNIYRDSFLV